MKSRLLLAFSLFVIITAVFGYKTNRSTASTTSDCSPNSSSCTNDISFDAALYQNGQNAMNAAWASMDTIMSQNNDKLQTKYSDTMWGMNETDLVNTALSTQGKDPKPIWINFVKNNFDAKISTTNSQVMSDLINNSVNTSYNSLLSQSIQLKGGKQSESIYRVVSFDKTKRSMISMASKSLKINDKTYSIYLSGYTDFEVTKLPKNSLNQTLIIGLITKNLQALSKEDIPLVNIYMNGKYDCGSAGEINFWVAANGRYVTHYEIRAPYIGSDGVMVDMNITDNLLTTFDTDSTRVNRDPNGDYVYEQTYPYGKPDLSPLSVQKINLPR